LIAPKKTENDWIKVYQERELFKAKYDTLNASIGNQIGRTFVDFTAEPHRILSFTKRIIGLYVTVLRRKHYHKVYKLLECGQPNDELRNIKPREIKKVRHLKLLFRALTTDSEDRVSRLNKLKYQSHKWGKIERRLLLKALELENIGANQLNKNIISLEDIADLDLSIGEKVRPVRIAMVLHTSIHQVENGYSIRSHEILRNINSNEFQVLPFVRGPKWFPDSLSRDNIEYRFHSIPEIEEDSLIEYIRTYALSIVKFALKNNISIIHGASNYVSGIASAIAAQTLNIPFIYDVRGLWELTRASVYPETHGCTAFNMQVRLETETAKLANHVLAISEPLRQELVRRGVTGDKITVCRNGYSSSDWQNHNNSNFKEIESKLKGKFVFGFIGSVTPYEGLSELINAFKIAQKDMPDAAILIIGDGSYLESVKFLVEKYNLSKKVIITGRLPWELAQSAYQFLDVACFLRQETIVAKIVSPLKPLEALAHSTLVMASNLPAMKDLLGEGRHVEYLSTNNIGGIVMGMKNLYDSDTDVVKRGITGKAWVTTNRRWSDTSAIHTDLWSKFSKQGAK